MTNYRIHIYFFFFLILILNGCECTDKGPVYQTCDNFDKVSKTISFEVYAKYRHNDMPIQNEGKVILEVTIKNYIWEPESSTPSKCCYQIVTSNKTYEKKFDQNGKAFITIDKFEFYNKYSYIRYSVHAIIPGTNTIDYLINSKYGRAIYDSPETSKFYFSYISEHEL